MSSPWDIPPIPMHGDSSVEETWAAVGRAMSEWEHLELFLARLYAKFLGIRPIEALARPEYRSASVFKARATVIENQAERYFIANHDQAVEGTFEKAICDIRKLALRRNDIAHGVVRLDWDHKKSFAQSVAANEYALVPSGHILKRFDQSLVPDYVFSSCEINHFSDHFRHYREGVLEILIATID